MTQTLTLAQHLKKIAPSGWAGKVAKHGEAGARKKQAKYKRDWWKEELKRRAEKAKKKPAV